MSFNHSSKIYVLFDQEPYLLTYKWEGVTMINGFQTKFLVILIDQRGNHWDSEGIFNISNFKENKEFYFTAVLVI